ncbi:MAG: hypothetical protein HKO53_06480 [Gemmatimonadetes bacterium]|nr:hypothetical protein [Gemmatimonadota bacterium]
MDPLPRRRRGAGALSKGPIAVGALLLAAGAAAVGVPDPVASPGEPATASAEPPMIGGPHPLVGYGADALRSCAPEDGGDWNVSVQTVTAASDLYPDQNPPSGTLQGLLAGDLPLDADLVVVVFRTGGLAAGNLPFRNMTRRSCLVIAGHTAPETYWVAGGAPFTGRPFSDIVYRGIGHIPDRRIDGGIRKASVVMLQCAQDSHLDQLSVAFGNNDMLSTVSGCARRVTVARSVCGPSAGGTAGRCGGMFGKAEHECGEQSWAWILGFENMRRNPLIGCGTRAPVNVTNVVTFNATDAGRVQTADVKINFRGILSLAGPLTRCHRDRAITWFEQLGPEARSEIFMEGVRSVGAPGCPWTATEAAWNGPHTVFHYSVSERPVAFETHGVAVPHPDPDHAVDPVPLDGLEDAVLGNVGANFRLACDGRLVRRPNALDRESIRRVRARDFADRPWESLSHYESVHGTVTFPEGVPCPDGNANGIPDEAERWLTGSTTGIRNVGELNPATGRPWILDYLGGR